MTQECVQESAYIINKMQTTVDPCTDFYEYACGKWEKNTVIPPSKSKYGSFSQISDSIKDILKEVCYILVLLNKFCLFWGHIFLPLHGLLRACGKWEKNTVIPPSKSKYGSFSQISDSIKDILKEVCYILVLLNKISLFWGHLIRWIVYNQDIVNIHQKFLNP